jgi:superoxide reductase
MIIGKNAKKVKIGLKKHPMEENHYIEWIEATSETIGEAKEGNNENKEVCKIFLKPGADMKAEAKFKFKVASARAYCNLHGLWKSG